MSRKKSVSRKTNMSLPVTDNSYGILAVIFGILSIAFSAPPITGIAFGVIAWVAAFKQRTYGTNSWAKTAKILATIGIILSILIWVFLIWLSNNPELLNQLGY